MLVISLGSRLRVLLFVTKVLGTCTWLKKYLMYLTPSKYFEYLYLQIWKSTCTWLKYFWKYLTPTLVWPWNLTDDLKNNRAPLLSNIKLYVSFHHHMWIQTGVTVRKRLSWDVTSVTLTFDLWPWPFAWMLPWSLVITPENFMMIQWWEHSQKGVTDRRTDRKYHS